MPVTPQWINWTHDAMDGLYDLAFLERHIHELDVEGRFPTARALQDAIQLAIKQLRPPLTVPEGSPALRIYNVLNLRYVQALTQAEAAAELNISVRHFKREQERAISAAAALLFEQISPVPETVHTEHITAALAAEFVRVDELLHLSTNVLEPLLQQHNLRVKVSLPTPAPVIRASRIISRQLVISALSWLAYDIHDDEVEVNVQVDSQHVLLRLVKPMSTERESRGGAGNGVDEELNTAQQLAVALGAQVHLQAIQAEPAARASLMFEVSFPISETRCVLMVEDNPDSVELVKRYLEQSGEYHLVAVMRADEAPRQAAVLRPACILLDIMMPERDGWDILTLLKADPLTAPIPVIVSSIVKGHDLAVALGAMDVLTKPFSAAQLIAKLHSVEAQARQSQARQQG